MIRAVNGGTDNLCFVVVCHDFVEVVNVRSSNDTESVSDGVHCRPFVVTSCLVTDLHCRIDGDIGMGSLDDGGDGLAVAGLDAESAAIHLGGDFGNSIRHLAKLLFAAVVAGFACLFETVEGRGWMFGFEFDTVFDGVGAFRCVYSETDVFGGVWIDDTGHVEAATWFAKLMGSVPPLCVRALKFVVSAEASGDALTALRDNACGRDGCREIAGEHLQNNGL